jgi:hypothetical protein
MPTYVERECVHGHPIGKWNTYCKRGHTSNQDVVSDSDTSTEKLTPKNRIESPFDTDLVFRIESTYGYPEYVSLLISDMGVPKGHISIKLEDLIAAINEIKKGVKK